MARSVIARPGIGITAQIVQRQALNIVRLHLTHPAIIMVRHGRKTLTTRQGVIHIDAGQAVALAADQYCDVLNQPAADGEYAAALIALDESLLDGFTPGRSSLPIHQALLLPRLSPSALQAFDQAMKAIIDAESLPPRIARHRMHELLLWLDLAGGHFVKAQNSTASKVRQLVAAAPDQRWSAAQLAQRLAMSQATLRRRLSAEATSCSALLVDVRMSFALGLLQSTDQPVADIALQAGYESASRFAIRFRQRFGFHPSSIRGHRRQGTDAAMI